MIHCPAVRVRIPDDMFRSMADLTKAPPASRRGASNESAENHASVHLADILLV